MESASAGTPRLIFAALHVQDLEASVRFYRDVLGVPLVETDLRGESGDPWLQGRRYDAVWRDGIPVSFSLIASAPGDESRRTRVGFGVADVESAHARAVEKGADVLHPPRAQPFGRTARYRDPDGNIVSLTQLA